MALDPFVLSGSTNGRPILVAATSTPGTLLHAATATAGELDAVWLLASNTSSGLVILTIEWGGVTSPDDTIIQPIPAQQGLVVAIPGVKIGGAAGLNIRAFASVANVVNVVGEAARFA